MGKHYRLPNKRKSMFSFDFCITSLFLSLDNKEYIGLACVGVYIGITFVNAAYFSP